MIKIVPDRDKYRNWYLDEDFFAVLSNGDTLLINKGFRFDAHSVRFPFTLIFPKYDEKDIIAALVHDYLVATQPWHRYTREFIDFEYKYFMEQYSYGRRKFWMPFAVVMGGFLTKTLWGDYRGEPLKDTQIEVTVSGIME